MSYKKVLICRTCMDKEDVGSGFSPHLEFDDRYFDTSVCDYCGDITQVVQIGIVDG